MKVPTLLGREPAVWAALASALIYFLGAFLLPLSGDQESVLNAVVVAGLGVWVAYATHDGQSAAILGAAKALISLGLGFGLHWTPEQQAVALTLVTAVSAAFVRTQATAPTPAGPTQ